MIFRSKSRERFSIEGVFGTVSNDLSKRVQLETCYLPNASYKRIGQMLQNIRYASTYDADVYHITGEVHFVALGLPKDKCIITIHDFVGLDKHYKGIKKFVLWLFWYYLPLRRCRYVTCISGTTKNELVRRFPFCKDKAVLIPNPLNPRFCRHEKTFNKTCPQILIIGTTPVKNVPRMIEALSGIDCKLHIIGDLNEEIEGKLKQKNVSYQSKSHLSDEEMLKEYIDCDMLLFVSEYEGFGMPIIEAQAIGRPVITSNIDPMKTVAGEGANLVNPFDVTDIRAGIIRVINDDEYRNSIVEKGFDNIKKYNTVNISGLYEELYNLISIKS